jgi:hypothetical protein
MKFFISNPKIKFKKKIGIIFDKFYPKEKENKEIFHFQTKKSFQKVLFAKRKKKNWGGEGEPYPGPLFVHPKNYCSGLYQRSCQYFINCSQN